MKKTLYILLFIFTILLFHSCTEQSIQDDTFLESDDNKPQTSKTRPLTGLDD